MNIIKTSPVYNSRPTEAREYFPRAGLSDSSGHYATRNNTSRKHSSWSAASRYERRTPNSYRTSYEESDEECVEYLEDGVRYTIFPRPSRESYDYHGRSRNKNYHSQAQRPYDRSPHYGESRSHRRQSSYSQTQRSVCVFGHSLCKDEECTEHA